jgi:hypothetical protein
MMEIRICSNHDARVEPAAEHRPNSIGRSACFGLNKRFVLNGLAPILRVYQRERRIPAEVFAWSHGMACGDNRATVFIPQMLRTVPRSSPESPAHLHRADVRIPDHKY